MRICLTVAMNTDSPLRRARKASGKTTTEVAAAVGVDQSSISRIERGTHRATSQVAEAIAKFLGNVSELEILYPERYPAKVQRKRGRAA